MVLTVTEPNASDVGVTVPWAVPVGEPATVSVKVTDPDVPLLAHTRRPAKFAALDGLNKI